MIEIFQVFIQLSVLLIFFLFPLSFPRAQKLIDTKINIYENISINIIINSFLFLIISFYNMNLIYYFWTIILLSVITNFQLFRNSLGISIYQKKIFIFFIICLLSISFGIASSAILGWDGLAHWFYKVLNFNQGYGYANLNNLTWNIYPHLGPYIWNFFWFTSSSEYEYSGRFFYVLAYLIPVFAMLTDLKNKAELTISFLLVIIIMHHDIFLFSGYQEYLIFFMISTIPILLKLKNKNNIFIILTIIILSLSLLPWIKREGIILSILILLSLKFSKKISNKELLFIAISLFITLFLYFIIRQQFTPDFSLDFDTNNQLSLALEEFLNFELIINKIMIISYEIVKASIKYPLFGLIVIILVTNSIAEKNVNNELIFLLLVFCLIYGLYLSPEWFKYIRHTLDRLLFEITGYFLLYFANYIKKLKV